MYTHYELKSCHSVRLVDLSPLTQFTLTQSFVWNSFVISSLYKEKKMSPPVLPTETTVWHVGSPPTCVKIQCSSGESGQCTYVREITYAPRQYQRQRWWEWSAEGWRQTTGHSSLFWYTCILNRSLLIGSRKWSNQYQNDRWNRPYAVLQNR